MPGEGTQAHENRELDWARWVRRAAADICALRRGGQCPRRRRGPALHLDANAFSKQKIGSRCRRAGGLPCDVAGPPGRFVRDRVCACTTAGPGRPARTVCAGDAWGRSRFIQGPRFSRSCRREKDLHGACRPFCGESFARRFSRQDRASFHGCAGLQRRRRHSDGYLAPG